MAPSTAVAVRCLECASVYVKPLGEGTAADNPGCPRCGYVGWIPSESDDVSEGPGPHHLAEDPPLHRFVRRG
jgi:hypothetical protein